jgi:hypothetical protein
MSKIPNAVSPSTRQFLQMGRCPNTDPAGWRTPAGEAQRSRIAERIRNQQLTPQGRAGLISELRSCEQELRAKIGAGDSRFDSFWRNRAAEAFRYRQQLQGGNALAACDIAHAADLLHR